MVATTTRRIPSSRGAPRGAQTFWPSTSPTRLAIHTGAVIILDLPSYLLLAARAPPTLLGVHGERLGRRAANVLEVRPLPPRFTESLSRTLSSDATRRKVAPRERVRPVHAPRSHTTYRHDATVATWHSSRGSRGTARAGATRASRYDGFAGPCDARRPLDGRAPTAGFRDSHPPDCRRPRRCVPHCCVSFKCWGWPRKCTDEGARLVVLVNPTWKARALSASGSAPPPCACARSMRCHTLVVDWDGSRFEYGCTHR